MCVIGNIKIGAEDFSVYEYIENSLMNMEEKIDISNYYISVSRLTDILNYILKSSPWLFFVNSGFAYSTNSQGNIKILYPEYNMDYDMRAEAFDFCLIEIEKILFYMPCGMNEFDRVLYIHDYICQNFEYDEKYEIGDMYGMLKNKRGTCQGYTYLFLELSNRVGLSCDVVYSDAMRHIWNAVRVDGEWYYIDLTWDDGDSFGEVWHKSFLFSDMEAQALGYYGYEVNNNLLCVSEKYSGEFLNYINVPMSYFDGTWYFVNNSATVRGLSIYNEENDTAQKIIPIDGYWQTEDNKIFANCFSSSVYVLGNIYFNGKNKIYRYSPNGCEEIYSAENKQIYYLASDGKNIYFSFSTNKDDIQNISIKSDGDVYGDGKTNLFDVVSLGLALESNNFDDINVPCADLNENRIIEDDDLDMLRYLLVGLKD